MSKKELTELQLRALSSPARGEIMSALAIRGASSASELAEMMDRKVKGLYYHLQALEAVGLVKVREVRKAHRRDEAIYEILIPDYLERQSLSRADHRDTMAETVSALLRYVDREVQRAYVKAERDPELLELMDVFRGTAALDEDTASEVRTLLRAAAEKVRAAQPATKGQRFGLTVVFSPIISHRSLRELKG